MSENQQEDTPFYEESGTGRFERQVVVIPGGDTRKRRHNGSHGKFDHALSLILTGDKSSFPPDERDALLALLTRAVTEARRWLGAEHDPRLVEGQLIFVQEAREAGYYALVIEDRREKVLIERLNDRGNFVRKIVNINECEVEIIPDASGILGLFLHKPHQKEDKELMKRKWKGRDRDLKRIALEARDEKISQIALELIEDEPTLHEIFVHESEEADVDWVLYTTERAEHFSYLIETGRMGDANFRFKCLIDEWDDATTAWAGCAVKAIARDVDEAEEALFGIIKHRASLEGHRDPGDEWEEMVLERLIKVYAKKYGDDDRLVELVRRAPDWEGLAAIAAEHLVDKKGEKGMDIVEATTCPDVAWRLLVYIQGQDERVVRYFERLDLGQTDWIVHVGKIIMSHHALGQVMSVPHLRVLNDHGNFHGGNVTKITQRIAELGGS